MIHGFKGFSVWKTHGWCYFQDLTSFEASKLARIQDGRHFGNTSYQNIGSNHIQAWNTYFLGFSSVNKLILDNSGSYMMEFKNILRVFRKKWPPFLTKMATGNQVQYEMVMWYVFLCGFWVWKTNSWYFFVKFDIVWNKFIGLKSQMSTILMNWVTVNQVQTVISMLCILIFQNGNYFKDFTYF